MLMGIQHCFDHVWVGEGLGIINGSDHCRHAGRWIIGQGPSDLCERFGGHQWLIALQVHDELIGLGFAKACDLGEAVRAAGVVGSGHEAFDACGAYD
jgi:hypothetical protein